VQELEVAIRAHWRAHGIIECLVMSVDDPVLASLDEAWKWLRDRRLAEIRAADEHTITMSKTTGGTPIATCSCGSRSQARELIENWEEKHREEVQP
jgi:hypothetical protein